MADLIAGFGRVKITPPAGVHMMGYAARKTPSLGALDDLTASAVALSDGATQVAILALDLSSLDLDGVATVKATIGDMTGLAPEQILLNTSHTHAGPMVAARPGLAFEKEYFAEMARHCAEAVSSAMEDQRPTTLSVGSAPVDIGGNRRERSDDGRIVLGVNPDGIRLPQVKVLHFLREEAPDIVLFSIPIHGTTMGSDNLWVSAEWMGAAVRDIEGAVPGVRSLFLQGCAGDQNPYRDERGYERVRAHGRSASEAVRQALATEQAVTALPLVNVASVLDLPLADGGRWPCPLHCLRLGEAALVGLAGEAFVEYALYAESHSSARSTITLGYTDGSIGYLPTEAAYGEGGYEVSANRYFAVGKPWDPSVEGVLKAEIAGLLDDLGVRREAASDQADPGTDG